MELAHIHFVLDMISWLSP